MTGFTLPTYKCKFVILFWERLYISLYLIFCIGKNTSYIHMFKNVMTLPSFSRVGRSPSSVFSVKFSISHPGRKPVVKGSAGT